MTTFSDDDYAAMIVRRFQRSGHSGVNTGLYDEINDTSKLSLGKVLRVEPGERVVVVTFYSESNWVALTTRRILGAENGQQFEIAWEDLVEIKPEYQLPERVEDLKKASISKLLVKVATGTIFQIPVEPGPPSFAFWNALLVVQQLGRGRLTKK